MNKLLLTIASVACVALSGCGPQVNIDRSLEYHETNGRLLDPNVEGSVMPIMMNLKVAPVKVRAYDTVEINPNSREFRDIFRDMEAGRSPYIVEQMKRKALTQALKKARGVHTIKKPENLVKQVKDFPNFAADVLISPCFEVHTNEKKGKKATHIIVSAEGYPAWFRDFGTVTKEQLEIYREFFDSNRSEKLELDIYKEIFGSLKVTTK